MTDWIDQIIANYPGTLKEKLERIAEISRIVEAEQKIWCAKGKCQNG